MAKGNNSEGDRENGKGEHIVGKGQRVVLKGEPPNEGELDFFFFFFGSPISLLGTNTQ